MSLEQLFVDQLKSNVFSAPVALLKQETVGEISLLCPRKSLADDVTKVLVRDLTGKPIAVVLCSSTAAPGMVERAMSKARVARSALGSELEDVVIKPLQEGFMDGVSYAVLPYCRPLSSSNFEWLVRRSLLVPQLFKLLHHMTESTCIEVAAEEIEPSFATPLRYLSELEAMPQPIRTAAKESLDRLTKGDWQPRFVLMHNDFWRNNILFQSSSTLGTQKQTWKNRFVIIDWAGSQAKGYAIYDLIRLARSVDLKQSSFDNQLMNHCQILQCKPIDARSYLMAALGNLGMNLEEFPLASYVQLAQKCFTFLEQAKI